MRKTKKKRSEVDEEGRLLSKEWNFDFVIIIIILAATMKMLFDHLQKIRKKTTRSNNEDNARRNKNKRIVQFIIIFSLNC